MIIHYHTITDAYLGLKYIILIHYNKMTDFSWPTSYCGQFVEEHTPDKLSIQIPESLSIHSESEEVSPPPSSLPSPSPSSLPSPSPSYLPSPSPSPPPSDNIISILMEHVYYFFDEFIKLVNAYQGVE